MTNGGNNVGRLNKKLRIRNGYGLSSPGGIGGCQAGSDTFNTRGFTVFFGNPDGCHQKMDFDAFLFGFLHLILHLQIRRT